MRTEEPVSAQEPAAVSTGRPAAVSTGRPTAVPTGELAEAAPAPRPVVDATSLTPWELRARIAMLQSEPEAQVERARAELAESLDRLRVRLETAKARAVLRVRAAARIAGGVAAAGAAVALVAGIGRWLSARRWAES